MWQGPSLRNGARENFAVMLMPIPASLLNGAPARGATVTKVNRCGTSGQLLTMTLRAPKPQAVERETFARNGASYVLMYSRPAGQPRNAAIESIIQTFCPTGSTLPNLIMPQGWSAVTTGSLETVGSWMGTSPMQMMTLMRGPRDAPLTTFVPHKLSTRSKINGMSIKLDTTTGTLCGRPAIFTSSQASTTGGFAMATDSAATQGSDYTYVLTYVRVATATDKAALASLKTLCAAPTPSPMPSATLRPS